MGTIISKIFVIFYVLASALPSQAMNKKWVPMGSLDDDGRKNMLDSHYSKLFNERRLEYSQLKIKNGGEGLNLPMLASLFLEKAIHQTPLDKFGSSFAYDGPIDDRFCKWLNETKDDEVTILMPAFGIGRSVLDALALNKNNNTTIIGNDIQEELKDELEQLRKKYGLNDDRVIYKMGDILKVLEDLKEGSVDVVYCPNLIHFFNPFEIQEFFVKLYKVMKPNGQIFLSWKGMSGKVSWGKGNPFLALQKATKFLENNGIEYPRYIEKDDFKMIEHVIYPYYCAEVKDIKNLAKDIFTIELSDEVSMFCRLVTFKPTSLNLGEYRYCSPEKYGEDYINFLSYLVLIKSEKNIDVDKITIPSKKEANEFFEKRRQQIRKVLDNAKKCSTCGEISENLKQCSACKSISYCSIECQKKDWLEHKKICNKKN